MQTFAPTLLPCLALSVTISASVVAQDVDHDAPLADAMATFHVEPLALAALQDGPTTKPTIAAGPIMEYELTAGAWLPRPGGNITFGPAGSATTIELEDDLRVEDLETTAKVELRIRKNDVWDINVSGFGFESDATQTYASTDVFGTLTLMPGDTVQSDFEMDSAHVELLYSYWRPYQPDATSPVGLRFAPGIGLRYVSSELSITQNGTSTDTAEGEWAIPYVAMMMEFTYDDRDDRIPLMESLRIAVNGGVGFALGGDGGGMAQIRAGLGWGLTENIEFLFGYRLLELDVDDENLNLDAGLQGLYLGGRVTF